MPESLTLCQTLITASTSRVKQFEQRNSLPTIALTQIVSFDFEFLRSQFNFNSVKKNGRVNLVYRGGQTGKLNQVYQVNFDHRAYLPGKSPVEQIYLVNMLYDPKFTR